MFSNQSKGGSIKSPKQVHLENDAKMRMWAIFAIVTLLELAYHVWTAIHNIPFLGRGIDPMFQSLGIAVGVTGEVFSLVMYGLAFFTAGKQRVTALTAHIVMVVILLINSGLRYNELVAGASTNEIVILYAQFGAPVVMFGVIAATCILLLHFDPQAQVREAENAVRSAQMDLRKTAIDTVKANMLNAMDLDNFTRELNEMGVDAMRDAVFAVRNIFGRGSSQPSLPLPRPNVINLPPHFEPPDSPLPPAVRATEGDKTVGQGDGTSVPMRPVAPRPSFDGNGDRPNPK